MTVRRCPIGRCRDAAGDPAWTEAGMCDSCAATGRHALEEIPALLVALTAALPAGSNPYERVAGSTDPAAPMSLDVYCLREDIRAGIIAWELEARDVLQLSAAKPAARRLSAAMTTLAAQYDRLAGTDTGAALVRWLLRQRSAAYRMLRWTTLVHRLPAPCPNCDLLDLVRHDGDDRVRCRSCGASWDEAAYERLVLVLAAEVSRP